MFSKTIARLLTRASALLVLAGPAVLVIPSAATAAPGQAALTRAAQAAPAASTAAVPYCGINWGSLPKRVSPNGYAGISLSTVRGVRSGRHACYDRLVIDLNRGTAGVAVRYVPRVVMDGSGQAIPVRGGAVLQIVVENPAYDQSGHPSYVPADRRELVAVQGYRTFRQVAWAGSFEGRTTIALGVRARLPMRVLVLDGPGSGSRVVIDVAHRW